VNVAQVLCAAGPVDAVTNQGLACRRLYARWGWSGHDYAAIRAPELQRGAYEPLGAFDARGVDALVVHYSGYSPEVGELLTDPSLARRTLLISHNITPARWFWEHEPFEGVRCTLGPGQLAELAGAVRVVAGVSEFNAREIRTGSGREDVRVIPVLFDRARLGPPRPPEAPAGAAPTILFVGRLAPHKRQDLVIAAAGAYRARHQADARLRLVGVPMSPDYGRWLAELGERLAPGAVTIESGIMAAEVADRYRAADVFLCLSEHEGFCIPLLEAFHFGVPVIARDAGAIAEVAGDAALLLDGADDVATVAELLAIAVADGELRAELRARGERRLSVYDLDRTAARLREAVTEVAG
jgi:glycosyltransferase involved in cell wall biosynthesis